MEEIGRASQFQMNTRTEAVASVRAVGSQGERARGTLTNSRAREGVVNTMETLKLHPDINQR